ncbi:aminodeoxychorismate/anthranilate synthase component II [[Haemophilus] felis]|uniref:anthranilate synthase n=1 Tax=[Haemophilus] felis TaxID=123822 RepID=A0A1T0BAD4_9PAST|nr:aminodeoxychorismate/anthranilate synthase component II [[Haemophilus] felis]NBI41544.1 aminodeoxychorismate/anthranilate synthase component II [[Haemophilus] felis]NBI43790.1 aminodeoxychorismate/anthranilate synthase component II [[Haemophilus] felis]OOS07170.1 anthranilate synthase component II [[Haemophilus] felis]
MAKILFLDNFDSFTYNLVDQLRTLGHQVNIYRNDTPLYQLIELAMQPDTIVVLSPGPGNPRQAGNLLPLIEALKGRVPMLGICLGHQALIEAFGGEVVSAGEILHGKTSMMEHDGQAMFYQLPNPMCIGRYHSLKGSELSEEWIVNGYVNNIVMAVRHRYLPICGFQFHPESILTTQGAKLLAQTLAWLEA